MTEHVLETRLALVVRAAPDRVVVRFKEGCKLVCTGIAEILDLRRKLGADAPHKVMIVMPEEVDFDMAMMTKDHYREHGSKDHTVAVAWVAQASLPHQMTSLYLSYHPSPFLTAVFNNEADALRWLDAPVMVASPN